MSIGFGEATQYQDSSAPTAANGLDEESIDPSRRENPLQLAMAEQDKMDPHNFIEKLLGSASGGGGGGGVKAPNASTPVGKPGSPMQVKPGTNAPATINGVRYSGHALDQMQARGVTPTVVQDTLRTGVRSQGHSGRTVYTNANNRVTVVQERDGTIVTVIH
jgi:hypothetical protein